MCLAALTGMAWVLVGGSAGRDAVILYENVKKKNQSEVKMFRFFDFSAHPSGRASV